MTNKEIAEKLRYVAEYNLSNAHLTHLADELDPPEPELEPGTVVWWRLKKSNDRRWRIGRLDYNGTDEIVCFAERCVPYQELSDIEWTPARTLDPGRVAVDRYDLENVLLLLKGVPRPGREVSVDRLCAALDRDKELNG